MPLTSSRRRQRTIIDLPPTDSGDGGAASARAGVLAGCGPIGDVRWRESVRIAGRVRSLRVQPRANVATLECTVVDGTGGITVVFFGRRQVAGVHLGTRLVIEGRAGAHHGKLAILNPDYTLLDS